MRFNKLNGLGSLMAIAALILAVAGCSAENPVNSHESNISIMAENEISKPIDGSIGNSEIVYTTSGTIVSVDLLKGAIELDNGLFVIVNEKTRVVMVNDRFSSSFDYRLLVEGMDVRVNGVKQNDGTILAEYMEINAPTREISTNSNA